MVLGTSVKRQSRDSLGWESPAFPPTEPQPGHKRALRRGVHWYIRWWWGHLFGSQHLGQPAPSRPLLMNGQIAAGHFLTHLLLGATQPVSLVLSTLMSLPAPQTASHAHRRPRNWSTPALHPRGVTDPHLARCTAVSEQLSLHNVLLPWLCRWETEFQRGSVTCLGVTGSLQ